MKNNNSVDAFGSPVYKQDGTYYERIRFTGREYFPEMGLYYFCNRWYDPGVGRFVSEDPARIAIMQTALHGWLLYSYGKNNPVFYRDPMGLQEHCGLDPSTGREICCIYDAHGDLCYVKHKYKCPENYCKTWFECYRDCILKYVLFKISTNITALGHIVGFTVPVRKFIVYYDIFMEFICVFRCVECHCEMVEVQ